ncbi:MAG: cytochrome b [Myxococcota bacterium]
MKNRWPLPLVLLHWLTPMLLVALVAVGVTMVELPADDALRRGLGRAHAVLGLLVGGLTFARLLLRRLTSAPTPLVLPPAQRRLASLVQALIYVTLFGLGASGVGTALGSDWHAFVQGELPSAPALGHLLSRQVHEGLVVALLVLAAVHGVGVGLEQVKRGGVVKRMLP